MKKNLILLSLLVFTVKSIAQVGINTANPDVTLDVRATNHNGPVTGTDGVLVPRVNDLSTAGTQNGQLVYLIANAGGFTQGFHYWNGNIWLPLISSDGDAWAVNGEDLLSPIARTGKVSIGASAGTTGVLNTNGVVYHEGLLNGTSNIDYSLLGISDANGELVKINMGGTTPRSWSTGGTLDIQNDSWDGSPANTTSGLQISGQKSGNLVFKVLKNEDTDGFMFINNNDILLAKIWGTSGDFRIRGSNAIKASGTTWTNPSDRRIKKNIENFTPGLDIIKKLRPVTYEFNGKAGFEADGKKHVGFIAQEVQEVAPYMVIENTEFNYDGIQNLKVIDESALTKILLNAVKEQQVVIESLQKRLDALEE